MHFLVELLGERPTWPDDMTWDEQATMHRHLLYLKKLSIEGKVVAAGPVAGRYGLVILEAGSEAEARAVMDNEPSVAEGVHNYRISPMELSILADHVGPDRYPAEFAELEIYREVTVEASLADVWHAWTTNEGAQTFFSRATNIGLHPFGPYEIYFDLAAAAGQQGGEGNKVLAFLTNRMLSFEWNAPPSFGPLRDIRTRVIIEFEPVGSSSVRVKFHHVGFGTGESWRKVYDYFDQAWTYVIANFAKRFKDGPLRWD